MVYPELKRAFEYPAEDVEIVMSPDRMVLLNTDDGAVPPPWRSMGWQTMSSLSIPDLLDIEIVKYLEEWGLA